MDLTATILDAVGRASATRGLDSTSLLPALARGQAEGTERSFFWRIDWPERRQKAVRRGRWKYVVDGDTQLLFDLDSDIGERHNAFAERPDVVRDLRKALVAGERWVGSPPSQE
jgi:arylsulfatase A-like enzyme